MHDEIAGEAENRHHEAEELRAEAAELKEVAGELAATAVAVDTEAELLEAEAEDIDRDGLIHFTVDGESLETRDHELTPNQILELAGLDPKLRYLTEVKPKDESFKGRGTDPIRMVNCMVFISLSCGPTTTS